MKLGRKDLFDKPDGLTLPFLPLIGHQGAEILHSESVNLGVLAIFEGL